MRSQRRNGPHVQSAVEVDTPRLQRQRQATCDLAVEVWRELHAQEARKEGQAQHHMHRMHEPRARRAARLVGAIAQVDLRRLDAIAQVDMVVRHPRLHEQRRVRKGRHLRLHGEGGVATVREHPPVAGRTLRLVPIWSAVERAAQGGRRRQRRGKRRHERACGRVVEAERRCGREPLHRAPLPSLLFGHLVQPLVAQLLEQQIVEVVHPSPS